MKNEQKMFCAPKKKIYISGLIISILISIPVTYIFAKIGEVLKNGESFKDITAMDITLIFSPILFLIIFISILAVVVSCDTTTSESKKK